MYKIVVTGGTGLIGSALVSKLKEDFSVYSIDKKGTDKKNLFSNVNYLNLDLSSKDCISTLESLKPNIIIHCAAIIPGKNITKESIKKINSKIDENIILLSKKLNSYLIFMSSTIVYGYSNNSFNINEETALKAISSYAEQKIESERLILNMVNRYLILRINAPYGQLRANETVLTIFCQQAIQNKTLQYHGSGTRMQDFTHVNDISSLIYCQLKSESFINGVFNISYGKPISMLNLAELIVKTTESNSEIKASGQIDKQENYKASYSIDKAKTILGWSPKITLQTGIKELLNNMRKC